MNLNLVFGTDTPNEESLYLVMGKLECPNGYVGSHFIVAQHMCGEWWQTPDGPKLAKGLPMWNGGNGDVDAPFTPISWAKLPDSEAME